ncbi:hypothetical protein [Staphylococcus chromogenes]|uniref:hypothetical protein n=1 Tax=Staphylococcus chromogenes TaxID=46126 RepID=UPI002884FA22|nr:hypothetical protein [Staphylococcus chromogenes]MDT0700404.1 hypothetical protein [Staphylococcus chromogenes]
MNRNELYEIYDGGSTLAKGYNKKKVLKEWLKKEIMFINECTLWDDEDDVLHAKNVIKNIKKYKIKKNNPITVDFENLLKIISDWEDIQLTHGVTLSINNIDVVYN